MLRCKLEGLYLIYLLFIMMMLMPPYLRAGEIGEKIAPPVGALEIAGENRTGGGLEIPLETLNAEYILGPGDKIEITVYRHDELTKTLLIGPSGKIIYPLLGEIQAGGLTIFELTDRIREGLLKYIIDPKVGVNLITVQSQTITLLGEVVKPGNYSFNPPLTLIEAISMAGGFTDKANQSNVMVIRKGSDKPVLKTFNLKMSFKKADFENNITLQKGDIICVPESFF